MGFAECSETGLETIKGSRSQQQKGGEKFILAPSPGRRWLPLRVEDFQSASPSSFQPVDFPAIYLSLPERCFIQTTLSTGSRRRPSASSALRRRRHYHHRLAPRCAPLVALFVMHSAQARTAGVGPDGDADEGKGMLMLIFFTAARPCSPMGAYGQGEGKKGVQ